MEACLRLASIYVVLDRLAPTAPRGLPVPPTQGRLPRPLPGEVNTGDKVNSVTVSQGEDPTVGLVDSMPVMVPPNCLG